MYIVEQHCHHLHCQRHDHDHDHDIHHHAHHQKTPLHHAVMNDDVFNLTKLLDDGADPNAQAIIPLI